LGNPTDPTPPPTPERQQRTLQSSTSPRPTATYEGPTTRAKSGQASAPEQEQKVGAESHIVTVSEEEFKFLKFQLEEAQRNINQKITN